MSTASSADTLEQVIAYLNGNNIDDDRIYTYLCVVDAKKLNRAIARFDRVANATRSTNKSVKSFAQQPRRSPRTGQ